MFAARCSYNIVFKSFNKFIDIRYIYIYIYISVCMGFIANQHKNGYIEPNTKYYGLAKNKRC